MTQLDNMLLFAEVVNHGSFTVAARALGLPLSTVSRRLADLERELSIRLLERTTRSLKTTEAGRIYYEHCRALSERAAEANRALHRLRQEPSGQVRIAIPFGVDSAVSAAIFSNFMNSYRKISVDIVVEADPTDAELGDVDIKITVGQKPVTHHRTALLGHANLGLYASPQYVGMFGNPARVDRLGAHQMVRFSPISLQTYAPEPLMIAEDNFRVSSNDLIMARQACLDGFGIAWLPSLICTPWVSTGALLRILPEFRYPLPLWLTTRTPNESTAKALLFADHFFSIFKTDKAWRDLEGRD